jgi:hypothetical protein
VLAIQMPIGSIPVGSNKFMKKFSLVTYRVEADFRPGLAITIQAESHWDAMEIASKKWGIPHKYITASLA